MSDHDLETGDLFSFGSEINAGFFREAFHDLQEREGMKSLAGPLCSFGERGNYVGRVLFENDEILIPDRP